MVLTHVHADFVPGHTELAERTGAAVAMSELAPVDFEVRHLLDGEFVTLGAASTGVSCYRSIAAASMLVCGGFSDVSDLLVGWKGWRADREASRPAVSSCSAPPRASR